MPRRIERTLVATAIAGALVCFSCYAAGGETAKGKGKKKADEAAAAAPAGTVPTDPGAAVAMVGDQKVTVQDLAIRLFSQQDFDAKKAALEEMINSQVLDREAAAKGVGKEKLLEDEVTSKVADPPQAEVDAWFEQNKARFSGQTKEQVAPRISAFLRGQKLSGAQKAYYATLRQKYGVKVLIRPPEISVDDDAAKGPAKAPITIVEFSDYQCPYCSRAETAVQQVLDKYGDKVRLVYRDYPLGFHQNAHTAAQASECAKDQGKFWEMHDAMFKNQQKLAPADLIETAGTIGLDKEAFKTCLDSGKKKDEVDRDFQDGQKYGVTGTPTFFINGNKVVGAADVSSFTEIIDQELQGAGK